MARGSKNPGKTEVKAPAPRRDGLGAALRNAVGLNESLPDEFETRLRKIDDATRQLKTELAFARAELRKLERTENPEPAALDAARAKLAEAERKLAANTAE